MLSWSCPRRGHSSTVERGLCKAQIGVRFPVAPHSAGGRGWHTVARSRLCTQRGWTVANRRGDSTSPRGRFGLTTSPTKPALTHNFRYESRGCGGIVVLPDSDHQPAGGCQLGVGVAVTGLVAPDLLSPVVGISFRCRPMVWAAVPEATVDEDGDSGSAEDQVGRSIQGRKRARSYAVPQAQCVDS